MAIEKHPMQALDAYLPAGSFELVLPLLDTYKVHLTISKSRQSKLGDYRRAGRHGRHRISVNGDLNPYAFLVTLLHELAHLLVNENHGWSVQPHGKEWKSTFSAVLKSFLAHQIFPEDITNELMRTINNPAASSCSEDGLQRILFNYDDNPHKLVLLETLAEGQFFKVRGGKLFQKGRLVRKRIQCYQMPDKQVYLISPLYAVKPMDMG